MNPDPKLFVHPVFWGAIATLLVAIFGFWVALEELCSAPNECQTKFAVFLAAPPNEIGDTLAGFAGALAFVWIIVTVWLQSIELAEQRKELERMANAQDAQVELLVKQGEIFEEEQKQRRENRAKEILNQRLRGLVSQLLEFPRMNIAWEIWQEGRKVTEVKVDLAQDVTDDLETHQALNRIVRKLESLHENLEDNRRKGFECRSMQVDQEKFGRLKGLLDKIVGEENLLSEADQQRIANLRICRLRSLLELSDLGRGNA